MNITFDKAIENHRKLWNWIADETKKRECVVYKFEYFKQNNISKIPLWNCYCCEYTADSIREIKDCMKCPIDWGKNPCFSNSKQCGYAKVCYDLWYYAQMWGDWQSAAKYARQTANIPAREEARR